MLHTAVLRSPRAHARVRKLDLTAALAAPGRARRRRARRVPRPRATRPGSRGAPVAAVAADTFAEARAALELVEVEWEELGAFLDPDDAIARGQAFQEPTRYERGDFERGLAEADVVVEAEYRTQTVLHNALETHQAVCVWEGDELTVYVSTQYVWGVRRRVADRSESRRTRCGSCAVTWAEASARRTAPATPPTSPRSWLDARAAPSAAR